MGSAASAYAHDSVSTTRSGESRRCAEGVRRVMRCELRRAEPARCGNAVRSASKPRDGPGAPAASNWRVNAQPRSQLSVRPEFIRDFGVGVACDQGSRPRCERGYDIARDQAAASALMRRWNAAPRPLGVWSVTTQKLTREGLAYPFFSSADATPHDLQAVPCSMSAKLIRVGFLAALADDRPSARTRHLLHRCSLCESSRGELRESSRRVGVGALDVGLPRRRVLPCGRL